MQLWYSSGRPRPTFRGIIHSLMFYTTPLWATYMLAHCDTWSERISATFFLAASSTLFWASSRYHLTLWKNRKDEEAGALVDYASISAMVASSLAPMYAQIGYYWGPFVLGISYALALLNIVMLNLTAIPRISRTAVYVAQGLIAIVPLASLNLTTFELMALLVTSTAYIVGSIIYAFETDALPWFIFRADIASKHWTYVETWHLLVTVAAISSFIANLSIIKRLPWRYLLARLQILRLIDEIGNDEKYQWSTAEKARWLLLKRWIEHRSKLPSQRSKLQHVKHICSKQLYITSMSLWLSSILWQVLMWVGIWWSFVDILSDVSLSLGRDGVMDHRALSAEHWALSPQQDNSAGWRLRHTSGMSAQNVHHQFWYIMSKYLLR